ncbi:MAG TPA: septal ring lytic transglycosylase RlpA family protein [Rhodanobacteraceae bacterium]|nr:septal ring lytic transglycosylase RlpA family protein [Rhodanobacteraceae bacterium]
MAWRVAVVLAVAVVLSACASHKVRPSARGANAATSAASAGDASISDNIHLSQDERYRLQHDGGPDHAEVDISALPEPVPKVEPRSRYGNMSSYKVNGKTYHVLSSAKGYDERGIASWYGNKFNGYLTSSMERYDMYKFSAASKVLPLPTYARVTNLANGKSVIVRVNDRGPFVPNRIIDLSYAAAVRIGIWPKGTGMVEVQAIDPAHPGELSTPPIVRDDGVRHGIWLQVGAFADEANARRVANRLRRADLAPVQVSQVTSQGRHLTRVRLGPLPDAAAADRISAAIQRLGLPAPQVAVD